MFGEKVPPSPPAAQGRRSACAFECWVAVAVVWVGCMVLVGWASGIQWLVNLVPGVAYMKPNTALAFVISGCSLLLVQIPRTWTQRAAQGAALVVGLISLLTLGEYVSGLDFGIDQRLFPISDPTLLKPHPGRMSINAVTCFGLTAAALFIMGRRPLSDRRLLFLAGIGALVAAVALFSVFGYLVLFVTNYGWGDLTGMAIHTSVLFLSIGAAILSFSWREAGGRWLIRPKLTAAFAVGLALTIAFAAFSQRSTRELMTAATRVTLAQEVIAKIHEFKGDFEQVGEGMRGFVITGDESFLTLTTRAIPLALSDLQELRKITADSPIHQTRLIALEALMNTIFDNARQVISTRRAEGFEAAAQRVASGRGKSLNEQARALLREMELNEKQQLVSRLEKSVAINQQTLLILPVGVFVSVVILIAVILRLNAETVSRQHVAEALNAAKLRLRFALEASRIGEWDLDLVTQTSRRSLMHDQIFGYAEMLPEWTYELFLKHVHPEDRARVDQLFQASLATGRDWEFECRIIRHDGTDGWIWARGSCVKDTSGKQLEMIGLVGDITEHKRVQQELKAAEERQRAAEELRRSNLLLEQHVRERTAELQAALSELDTFTYSVSHDLRAPLRAVDGFTRMVVEDYAPKLDDEGRRMLGVIRAETQRMSHLIDDLLAFSRIGRQQVAPEPIDMHALAQEVFDELAQLAPDRNLRLKLQPLPPAVGTPPMIRQVWVNLLSNAIKFTKGREPAVVEIGAQVGADGLPVYYVKDNGVGFDMRHADKLFGVFERLHRSEEFEGTGVGLSLVKRIVQRHSGRVWAEGEVGRGATFYFTLSQTPEKVPDGLPSAPTTPPSPIP